MKWLAMGLSSLEEAVLIVVGILLIVLVIFWFFSCIGNALIIKKAGRNFFLGFVPIYNDYVLCEISGTSYFWFALKYGVPFLVGIIEGMMPYEVDSLSTLSAFATIGFIIALSASISNSFGKGMFTTVMLVLFGPIAKIYLGIIGEYLGAKGCNDVIFRGNGVSQKTSNNFSTNINNSVINNHPEYHFCPNCGNAITEYDRFCNKCGREI